MLGLLEKVRRINKGIQQFTSHESDCSRLCTILAGVIETSIYVLDRQGVLLGSAVFAPLGTSEMEERLLAAGRINAGHNRALLKIAAATITGQALPGLTANAAIIPLRAGGGRTGTLILLKGEQGFADKDLILSEYAAMVVGMEILHVRSDELGKESRLRSVCQIALDALSFSEQEAMEHIFAELNCADGLLIASKIADDMGITRSVIINGLRKLESAGIIDTRSLGMKGTYIRILNRMFPDELAKYRTR